MDPTTETSSGYEGLKELPYWMIVRPMMLPTEADHSGKGAATANAMDMARLEHALPSGDLHQPRVVETAERSCSVCLKNLEEDNRAWMMPCSHTFHQLCILGDMFNCPVCHPALKSSGEKPAAPRTTQ